MEDISTDIDGLLRDLDPLEQNTDYVFSAPDHDEDPQQFHFQPTPHDSSHWPNQQYEPDMPVSSFQNDTLSSDSDDYGECQASFTVFANNGRSSSTR